MQQNGECIVGFIVIMNIIKHEFYAIHLSKK